MRVDNRVGERIKRAIRAAGTDQGRLARELNIGRETLNRALNGQRSLDVKLMEAIAGNLGVPLSSLVGDAAPSPAVPTPSSPEHLEGALAAAVARIGDGPPSDGWEVARILADVIRLREERALVREREVEPKEADRRRIEAETRRLAEEATLIAHRNVERAIQRIPLPAGRVGAAAARSS